MRLSIFSLFLLFLAFNLSSTAVAQETLLNPGFANGVPYLSGGIGDEELDELERARPNYNTRFVLSEASGAYVSDVALQVTTVLGEPIVALSGAGPIVLLQLSPGTYLIAASYDGRTVQKRLDVADNTARTISLIW